MTEPTQATPRPSTPKVLLQVAADQYSVVPGSTTHIPLLISNKGAEEDYIELSIKGIPISWVSFEIPVIRIPGGGQAETVLTIQAPPSEQVRAGKYPIILRAASQEFPDQAAEIEITLTVAAYEVQGRIGILLESTQFAVAPGGETEIPVVLLNQGLVEDQFRLAVEELSPSWISTATPMIKLNPGEQREILLIIRPPRMPQTRAGRHPFKIKVISQAVPDQFAMVECTLTIAAYTKFSAQLDPSEIQSGEKAQVLITNQGNIHQNFTIEWQSEEDALTFEPEEPQQVQVPAGETFAIEYSASPSRRPVFGGEYTRPFSAVIKSSERDKEQQVLPGSLSGRALIPFWVLPTVAVIAMVIFCVAFLLFQRGQRTEVVTSATETALAVQSTLIISATETASVFQTEAALSGERDDDADGLNNREEAQIGTDPNNPDTDGDGLTDGDEVKVRGTDPLNPDMDDDELSDGEELLRQGTDLRNPDSDGDRLTDGDEVLRRKTDPRIPDTDADAFNDGDEIDRGTDPLNPDSDKDELKDGDEIRLGTDPLRPDSDNDRLTDGVEARNCPDPLNPDTDTDGIIDGLDIDPCDPNNPSLTATAAARQPTATTVPPTSVPPTATSIPPTAGPTSTPAPPPLSGTIVFETSRDGDPELYAMNMNNYSVARLTNSIGVDTQAAWSPDGSRIAFISNRTGNNDIYIMNANGTGQVNITNNPADDQYPTWSNDGQLIIFTTNREGNQEIYSMRTDGSDLVNLSNSPGSQDFQPDWYRTGGIFASGDYILFVSDRTGNLEVFRMNTDGTNQSNLTNHPANDVTPIGSRAGDQIAFTTDRDGNTEIYIMNANGTGQSNLTQSPSADEIPTWSPDSRWVAFTTNRAGNQEIFIIRTNRSEIYNVTNNPANDLRPAWD